MGIPTRNTVCQGGRKAEWELDSGAASHPRNLSMNSELGATSNSLEEAPQICLSTLPQIPWEIGTIFPVKPLFHFNWLHSISPTYRNKEQWTWCELFAWTVSEETQLVAPAEAAHDRWTQRPSPGVHLFTLEVRRRISPSTWPGSQDWCQVLLHHKSCAMGRTETAFPTQASY